ncbi:MAG TPA: hypothetical protein VF070_11975 [Streptosporangiaceae bacterium]
MSPIFTFASDIPGGAVVLPGSGRAEASQAPFCCPGLFMMYAGMLPLSWCLGSCWRCGRDYCLLVIAAILALRVLVQGFRSHSG